MKYILSIIVPVYKVEDFLVKCVNSLIEGCGENFDKTEILLINDGSPDKCPEICDSFSEKYGNIKTIHKTNGGVSSARNLGIEHASGEYITFCDSDDYVTNEFSKIFDYINLYPEIEVFSVGLIRNNKFISKFEDEILNPQIFSDAYSIVKRDVTISCCAKIVKKTFLLKNNIYFPEGIKSEDFVWSCMLLTKVLRFMLVNLAYYNYVDRASSVTHSTTITGVISQINNYRLVKNMIKNKFLGKQGIKLLRYLMQGIIYVGYTCKYLKEEKRIAYKLLKENKELFYVPHNFKYVIGYIFVKLFILK